MSNFVIKLLILKKSFRKLFLQTKPMNLSRQILIIKSLKLLGRKLSNKSSILKTLKTSALNFIKNIALAFWSKKLTK